MFLALSVLTLSAISQGVVIVDASNTSYFEMKASTVRVDVNNQVALITANQIFVNSTGFSASVKYAFPMPETGTAIELKWKIHGKWFFAEFSASPQDPAIPGGNGQSNPYLTKFLGTTPLFFSPKEKIEDKDTIEFQISYVQLLEYKLDKVKFHYPADYSLIQNTNIQSQIFEFRLFSTRSIISIEPASYNPGISADKQTATVSITSTNSKSIKDINLEYQLASNQLGLISFSNFMSDSSSVCDEYGNGFLGMVIEPESNENTQIINKRFTLIIDCSGSMLGLKIEQAKEAAEFIVKNLNFGDYFNIISFSTEPTSFRPEHVPYNPTNQEEALSFISDIKADGSTNISEALALSINQFPVQDKNYANIIIFFTDGEATIGLTATSAILDLVKSTIAKKETDLFLFTFGVGSSVNKTLLTRLAMENQGISSFITNEEVSSVIPDFYLTVKSPVLLNTKIEFTPNLVTEVYPNPLPNLYKGMQLVLTGRYKQAQNVKVKLSGKNFSGNIEYNYDLNLSGTTNTDYMFLPKLWAKSKIEYLTYLFYTLPEFGTESQDTKKTIEEISLCYQVISSFTSFEDNTQDPPHMSLEIDEILKTNEEYKYNFQPNPFDTQTTLKIELQNPQIISVRIYDINGELIKTIIQEGFTGINNIVWMGKKDNNDKVSKGVYFYRIEIAGKFYFGKILKN